MEFTARTYCIKRKNSCIPKDCFQEPIIRVNTLSAKSCFLKLEIDTVASILYKATILFLNP